jgi:hypothetical protein
MERPVPSNPHQEGAWQVFHWDASEISFVCCLSIWPLLHRGDLPHGFVETPRLIPALDHEHLRPHQSFKFLSAKVLLFVEL